MKVVAFNCSPHKDGNTAHMIADVLKVLNENGIETETVQVGGSDIRGCRACNVCVKRQDMKCVFVDDILNKCIAKMVAADGIIIGSPTYFGDLTPECKALIDRAGYVIRHNGNPLVRKVGAALAPEGRAGAVHTIDSIIHLFTISGMYVASSSYWNVSLARDSGDYELDAMGKQTMRDLGANMAFLLKKLAK